MKVNADNEAEAEMLAVNRIKTDSQLLKSIDRSLELDPAIFLESISKLAWWGRLNSAGYSFYPMEE